MTPPGRAIGDGDVKCEKNDLNGGGIASRMTVGKRRAK